MKRKPKLNLVLQLATICLCVCAIAIGVYSVKNASLSVTGTVNFTAHNCLVKVDVSMYGDAVGTDGTTPDKAGTPRASASARKLGTWDNSQSNAGTTLATVTGDTGSNQCYFSDMGTSGEVEDIVLVFNITNNSDFPVTATIKDVTGTNMTFANANGMNFSGDAIIASLPAKVSGTNTSTATLQLKLNIKDISVAPGDYTVSLYFGRTKETSLTVKAKNDFFYDASATAGRSTGYSSSDITDADKQATRNYVEMGSIKNDDSTTTPLRWYIFAKSNSTTGAMEAVTDKIVDDGQALPKGTYWFISEKYSSQTIFEEDDAILYDNSNRKAFLANGFLSEIGINIDTDSVYNKISSRLINDHENAKSENSWKETCSTSEPQKLWLLSVAEVSLLNGGYDLVNCYGAGQGSLFYKNLYYMWTWLRTDYCSNSSYAINHAGGVVDVMNFDGCCVSPAFQITI